MTAQTSPRPASLQRAEHRAADLDARIVQAEQRLILREENLHRRFAELGHRLQNAMQPRRVLGPVLGVAALGAGLAWLWGGRRAGSAPHAPLSSEGSGAAGTPGAGTRHGSVPWVRLVGFVWPLLPATWRARVSPNTVNMVMALGLPMAEALFTRRPPRPMTTAGPLSSASLAGTWHEVARLPSSSRAALRVQFTPRGDGGIDLLESRVDDRGVEHVTHGLARPQPGSGGARLRVSRWSPGLRWLSVAGSDEWVLHLGDGADELMLGSPQRDTLRLLARRRRLPPGRLHVMVETARDQGFAVERLQFVDGL